MTGQEQKGAHFRVDAPAGGEAGGQLQGDGLVNAGHRGQVPVSTRAPGERAASELKRAKETEGVLCQTHVGGQALIEGIMMRGRYNWSVAVREPSGQIYTEEHDLASGRPKNSWMYKPVVRGCTAMAESMALGFKALEVATQHAFADLDDEVDADNTGGDTAKATASAAAPTPTPATAPTPAMASVPAPATAAAPEPATQASASLAGQTAADHTKGNAATAAPAQDTAPAAPADADEGGAIPKPLITGSMVIGVLLGIAVFIALPAVLTNFIVGDYSLHTLLWNIVDGVIRIAIFIAYLWLIGRMKDVKRMFGYHGAEHKTIHCFEHGCELTPENAARFPRLHVRCGTAFLLMTLLIAIIVYTVVPVGLLIDAMGVTSSILRLVLVIVTRIILLPLIAGFSYEVTVKWAGSRPQNPLVQVVLWPGLQMQRLTTRQPDKSQLECAIAAMQLVLEREESEQRSQQQQEQGKREKSGQHGQPDGGAVSPTLDDASGQPASAATVASG